MQIYLNGKPTQVSDGINMVNLVEQLRLSGQRLAVEVNEELVPRSSFPGQVLREGDRVEIIHAVGGG